MKSLYLPVWLAVLDGHLDLDYIHVRRRLQSATTATVAALLPWHFHHASRDTAVMIVNTWMKQLAVCLQKCHEPQTTVFCIHTVLRFQWQRLFSSTIADKRYSLLQRKLTSPTAPAKLEFRVDCNPGGPTVSRLVLQTQSSCLIVTGCSPQWPLITNLCT